LLRPNVSTKISMSQNAFNDNNSLIYNRRRFKT
jgi:hypothetical protein